MNKGRWGEIRRGKVLTARLSMKIFAPLCVFLLRASNSRVIPFDICSGLEGGRGGREGGEGGRGGREGREGRGGRREGREGGREGGKEGKREVM